MQAQHYTWPNTDAHWAPLLTLQLFLGFLGPGQAHSQSRAGTGERSQALQMTPTQRGAPFLPPPPLSSSSSFCSIFHPMARKAPLTSEPLSTLVSPLT